MIHSLGKAFMSHKVSDCVAFNVGDSKKTGSTEGSEQKMFLQKLIKLEQCSKHQQPIEYYLDEDVDEDASFELSGVVYGCQRCVASADSSI